MRVRPEVSDSRTRLTCQDGGALIDRLDRERIATCRAGRIDDDPGERVGRRYRGGITGPRVIPHLAVIFVPSGRSRARHQCEDGQRKYEGGCDRCQAADTHEAAPFFQQDATSPTAFPCGIVGSVILCRDGRICRSLPANLGRGFGTRRGSATGGRRRGWRLSPSTPRSPRPAPHSYGLLESTRLAMVTSVTKLLPGWPVPAPSSSLPVVSLTPFGGVPTTVNV